MGCCRRGLERFWSVAEAAAPARDGVLGVLGGSSAGSGGGGVLGHGASDRAGGIFSYAAWAGKDSPKAQRKGKVIREEKRNIVL